MRLASFLLVAALALSASSPEQLVVTSELPPGDQGTMHYARALSLSIGEARPLVLDGDLPIPGPSYRLPDGRFFLLGWSSSGGGMQALHALLVGVRDGAVQRLGDLTYTTDRAHAGLLVRRERDGALRIGLPQITAERVHEPEDWSLAIVPDGASPAGGARLALAALRSLPTEAVVVGPDDLLYSPPMGNAPRPSRVVWCRVTQRGFEVDHTP